MTCIWCFDKCIPLEAKADTKTEPVVDVEKVIKAIAWRELRELPPENLTKQERLCPLHKVVRLEVDKSFLSIRPADTMRLEMRRSKAGGFTLPEVSGGNTVLFQSQFKNRTKVTQTYSFKTERQTRSLAEISLQRGFTVGSSLDIDVKIPTGVEGCGVSGKLGSQLQWSFSRGKMSRQEETVTWAVDTHVEVAPESTGVATLAVYECQWSADFSLPCAISAHPHPGPDPTKQGSPLAMAVHGSEPQEKGEGDAIEEHSDVADGDDSSNLTSAPKKTKATKKKIPVFVRRVQSGDLVEVIYVPCASVCKECPSHFTLSKEDLGVILCDLRGSCHVVCAVEQKVDLHEATLVPPYRTEELSGPIGP